MKRLLVTSTDGPCPYNCYYCFAKADNYEKPLALAEVEKNRHLLEDVDALYPSCDSDIFAGKNPIQLLKRTAKFGKTISISTKSILNEHEVVGLAEISKNLLGKRHILNVGISFSTKDSINILEPGTATYAQRLQNLRLLSKYGVFSSVILKPIIVEVPIKEYLGILQDTMSLTRNFLIGEEYLIRTSPQSQEQIQSGYIVKKRKVSWVNNSPLWPVRIAREHINAIKQFLETNQMDYFESDLLLLKQAIARQENCRTIEM